MFKKKTRFDNQDLGSILRACKFNDSRAQRCLIGQFASYAKVVAARYASNSQEEEEIVNDSFLKVFLKLDQYNESQPFKSWFRRIIINTSIDYYRRKVNWQVQLESLDNLEIEDWSIDTLGDISAEEILSLIQSLPTAYRVVFTLYVIDGYSHKEITQMLHIQEGTSKSNLRDARRRLRNMIKAKHPDLYEAYIFPNKRI